MIIKHTARKKMRMSRVVLDLRTSLIRLIFMYVYLLLVVVVILSLHRPK